MKTPKAIISEWAIEMGKSPFLLDTIHAMMNYFAKQNNLPQSEIPKHFGDWLSYRPSQDGNILNMCRLWFIAECVYIPFLILSTKN